MLPRAERGPLPKFDPPRMYADFNEMTAQDLVLVSRDDHKRDSDGNLVEIREGLRVYLYMEDGDEGGVQQYLLATGICEINTETGWSSHVRWCCRIDRWE